VFETFLQSLEGTAVATAVREGESLFPWIECLHVLALALVIGSIAAVDLRLIGLTARSRGVAQTTAAMLPLTWTAFGFAVITGGLLFASNATTYGHNTHFQVKMTLIASAGCNMLVYHLFLGRGAETWHSAAATPLRARIAGAISLALWIAVAAFGRWIGFTINAPA